MQIWVEEVVESARRTSTVERFGSDLYRASDEDTGDIRESYTEPEDQGVQNAMESPYREDKLRKTYPDPFASQPLESRDEIPVWG